MEAPAAGIGEGGLGVGGVWAVLAADVTALGKAEEDLEVGADGFGMGEEVPGTDEVLEIDGEVLGIEDVLGQVPGIDEEDLGIDEEVLESAEVLENDGEELAIEECLVVDVAELGAGVGDLEAGAGDLGMGVGDLVADAEDLETDVELEGLVMGVVELGIDVRDLGTGVEEQKVVVTWAPDVDAESRLVVDATALDLAEPAPAVYNAAAVAAGDSGAPEKVAERAPLGVAALD